MHFMLLLTYEHQLWLGTCGLHTSWSAYHMAAINSKMTNIDIGTVTPIIISHRVAVNDGDRNKQHQLKYFMTWASCQIRKLRVMDAPGRPGTFSPPPQVRDFDMHHGTCVTHLPWCMPGLLTSGFRWSPLKSVEGKTLPAFPAHAQPAILLIW